MDAVQREGGQQKTRFSYIRRAGSIARTILLSPISATASSPLGELAPWPSEARLPGPSLEGLS
jgi:hypothetical protein